MFARRFVTWLIWTLLFVSPLASWASRSGYERGVEAAESYRYGEALMHFQQAAEQGDRNARRSLGLMLLYGSALYGPEVTKNPEQARRWLQAAAHDGCEVSNFMLKTLAQKGR